MDPSDQTSEQLATAIAGLEAQRAVLGDAVVGPALRALREQLAALERATLETLQEERKHVTVLFADLSGFSDLARQLDPERTRALVNACFGRLVPVIEAYGGTVDKFVGDAVVALFGAPVAHEDDPERALRAALEMREALEAFNRDHGTDLGLHFGVNTGRVVTGAVGAGARGGYSVIGRPVNVAARLEAAAPRGEIFVGLDTWRRTAPVFEFETLPPLRVQGENEAVPVFRLLGVKAAPGPRRGLAGLESPLVGRDAELERLQAALDALRRGRGARLVVAGEAGIGKSRLLAEVRRSVGDAAGWVEARALAHTRESSYAVARTLVLGLLDVTADAGSSRTSAALHDAMPPSRRGPATDHAAYLSRLLDLSLDAETQRTLAGLAAEVVQRRIIAACAELVRVRAARRPLVLLWEDVHWADPSSLRVLEALLPLADELPLAVVVVCRPEESGMPRLLARLRETFAGLIAVDLEPLSRDASTRLLRNLVDLEGFEEATRSRILGRAEGNPFFLEEILRSLIEQGVVAVVDGRARAVAAATALHLPDTLEGVVASRIDRLAPHAKRVLQTASVIGRLFADRLLERVAAGAIEDGVRGSLLELEHRAFVRRRGDGNGEGGPREYIFKHAITQEVAYETLLLARRRELHGRVGEAIEAIWPDQLAERSALLGYHFRRAGVIEKAVRYLTLAGDRARATYANEEALGFYGAALDLLGEAPHGLAAGDTRVLRLLESRADVLHLGTRHAEARADYERALGLAPRDAVARSRLHRKVAVTYESQRRFPEALQAYELGERELAGRDDAEAARELIDLRLARLWVHYVAGDVARMEHELEHVRPLVERHADAAQSSLFFSRRANMASRRDRYVVADGTVEDVRRAVAAALESGDLVQVGNARFLLGLMRFCRGELEQAERELTGAREITHRTGDLAWETRCVVYLAAVARGLGRAHEARELAQLALEMSQANGLTEYVPAAGATLAWANWREGDAARALAQAREALEAWQHHWKAYPFQWLAGWPCVAAALAMGDMEAAVAAARAILGPVQQLPAPAAESALREAVARAGRGESAREALEAAVRAAAGSRYL